MTLAENLRTKYGLTSLKIDGNCLPVSAINEALEQAAQIADRNHDYDTANQIRRLKRENSINVVLPNIEDARGTAS